MERKERMRTPTDRCTPQLPQSRATRLDVAAFLLVRGFQIVLVDLAGGMATFTSSVWMAHGRKPLEEKVRLVGEQPVQKSGEVGRVVTTVMNLTNEQCRIYFEAPTEWPADRGDGA
jgi:hypothetical protein